MTISSLFQSLGAPLANTRWSWGAQRSSDGAVFLRVWQDLKFIQEGRAYYMVDAGAPSNVGSSCSTLAKPRSNADHN
jgi:hypothetical protein